MTAQLLLVLSQYGLIVVGLNVLLNQIGLPVPALPTLIVAGAAAANGQLSSGGVFSIAVAACLIADCSWFFVGQRYGIRVLRLLCRISLEPDSCVSQTQIGSNSGASTPSSSPNSCRVCRSSHRRSRAPCASGGCGFFC